VKLEKAIEILKLDLHCDFDGDSDDLVDALQLAIESLEREQDKRARYNIPFQPLPGETKD